MWGSIVAAAGPWLLKFAPWVAAVPQFATIKRWLRVATYVAALGAGAWFGGKAVAWWQGEKITLAEADKRGKQKCDDTLAAATFAAKERALSEREAALAARERDAALAETELDILAQKLEADRAAAENPNGNRALISADDRWLRSWRGK